MDKRYEVSGLFSLEVDARDMNAAQKTAERILRDSGIDGRVIRVEEELEK